MTKAQSMMPQDRKYLRKQHKWMERANGCWLLMNSVQHLSEHCLGSEVSSALNTLPNNRVFKMSAWEIVCDYLQADHHKAKWLIKLCINSGMPSPSPFWTKTVWPNKPFDVFNAMRETCIIKSGTAE